MAFVAGGDSCGDPRSARRSEVCLAWKRIPARPIRGLEKQRKGVTPYYLGMITLYVFASGYLNGGNVPDGS